MPPEPRFELNAPDSLIDNLGMPALSILTTLAILGIRSRYIAAGAVVLVVLLVLALVVARRSRKPRLELRELAAEDMARYTEEFAGIEREFVERPEQAAARARGVVEEAMRRRGFPDRIEPAQRIRDLAGHDRDAARALEAANTDLKGAGGDTERLRRVVQSYRAVLNWLIGRTEAVA